MQVAKLFLPMFNLLNLIGNFSPPPNFKSPLRSPQLSAETFSRGSSVSSLSSASTETRQEEVKNSYKEVRLRYKFDNKRSEGSWKSDILQHCFNCFFRNNLLSGLENYLSSGACCLSI